MNYYYISEDEIIIDSLTSKEVAEAKVPMKSKFCTVSANECLIVSIFSNSIVLLKLFPLHYRIKEYN